MTSSKSIANSVVQASNAEPGSAGSACLHTSRSTRAAMPQAVSTLNLDVSIRMQLILRTMAMATVAIRVLAHGWPEVCINSSTANWFERYSSFFLLGNWENTVDEFSIATCRTLSLETTLWCKAAVKNSRKLQLHL